MLESQHQEAMAAIQQQFITKQPLQRAKFNEIEQKDAQTTKVMQDESTKSKTKLA